MRLCVDTCEAGSWKHSANTGAGRVGPAWGQFGKASESQVLGRVWARSKSKQEKGGGVAMLPTSGSQRPATPVVSGDSGLSGLQNKIGLLILQFPENRVARPINGCITANIQGLLYKL